MNNPKSGIKTTEFWVVVIGSILAVGVAGGYVSQDQAQQVTDAAAQVLNAVVHLVEALTLIGLPVSYVWSRTKVKTNK